MARRGARGASILKEMFIVVVYMDSDVWMEETDDAVDIKKTSGDVESFM
jgi:hypothetical protein